MRDADERDAPPRLRPKDNKNKFTDGKARREERGRFFGKIIKKQLGFRL